MFTENCIWVRLRKDIPALGWERGELLCCEPATRGDLRDGDKVLHHGQILQVRDMGDNPLDLDLYKIVVRYIVAR